MAPDATHGPRKIHLIFKTHLDVGFTLYNNVWGTNFPMWYGEDARFRFVLRVE